MYKDNALLRWIELDVLPVIYRQFTLCWQCLWDALVISCMFNMESSLAIESTKLLTVFIIIIIISSSLFSVSSLLYISQSPSLSYHRLQDFILNEHHFVVSIITLQYFVSQHCVVPLQWSVSFEVILYEWSCGSFCPVI